MSGTLSSFNTAISALRHSQVGMDITGNNIANVSTTGYARRRVEAQAAGAPQQVAAWSRYDGHGDGVRIAGISRMTDELLNTRSRTENGNQSYLQTVTSILGRVENGIGEPGDSGVSAALSGFSAAWHDLANNPSSDAARAQVLGATATVADAFNTQARNIGAEIADQRHRVLADVTQANTLIGDLAATNKSLQTAKLDGTDPAVLQDQRDQLALSLAKLIGASGTLNADGGMDLTVGGVSLVAGSTASTLNIATGVTPTGAGDNQPITFTVTHADGTTEPAPAGMRGELGAVVDTVDVTLTGYLTDLGKVASDFASNVNQIHAGGFDPAGNPGGPVFTFNPADPAGTLTGALTSRDQVAASATPGVLDTSVATRIAEAHDGADAYNRLVTAFGSTVDSTNRLAANQQVLTTQIDNSRESLSGVNLDEEMVTMLSYQRSYEAAAKLLTTLDSVLDTLINRTGVTR